MAASDEIAGASADLHRDDTRRADHAAIDRLAADLVPALVDRLGAAGLGELEVREAGWRLRLRLPPEAAARARAAALAAVSAEADPDNIQLTLPDPTESGGPPGAAGDLRASATAPDPPAVEAAPEPARPVEPPAVVARSVAVGFFRPGKGIVEGASVRKGHVIGAIDVLGVSHDVAAPAAGVIVAIHVSAGEPVEYGQEILAIGHPAAQAHPPARPLPAAMPAHVAAPTRGADAPTSVAGVQPGTPGSARPAIPGAGPEGGA